MESRLRGGTVSRGTLPQMWVLLPPGCVSLQEAQGCCPHTQRCILPAPACSACACCALPVPRERVQGRDVGRGGTKGPGPLPGSGAAEVHVGHQEQRPGSCSPDGALAQPWQVPQGQPPCPGTGTVHGDNLPVSHACSQPHPWHYPRHRFGGSDRGVCTPRRSPHTALLPCPPQDLLHQRWVGQGSSWANFPWQIFQGVRGSSVMGQR